MYRRSPNRRHALVAAMAASAIGITAIVGIPSVQPAAAAANAFSSMSEVAMINLAVMADDQLAADKAAGIKRPADYYTWKGTLRTYPTGMEGQPEGFAQLLRSSLPTVNTLRLPFNEHSFDATGHLHSQYERFLAESAKQGFHIVFVYAAGPTQNLRSGLTPTQAATALGSNYGVVQGAWDKMLNWLDRNPTVKARVFGVELMNEPASYKQYEDKSGPYTRAYFVKLYADHSIALARHIAGRVDARILVDGFGYAGDFVTLSTTKIGTQTAISYIKAGVGSRLVWSWHYYPGWGRTIVRDSSGKIISDGINSPDDQIAAMRKQIDPLSGTPVIMTETNMTGEVDDIRGGQDYTDYMNATYEFLAIKAIGIGWFPGAEFGGSNLVVIDNGRSVRYLHQHSLAHALDAFSAYDSPRGSARRGQTIDAKVIPGRLRNESYQDPRLGFDAASGLGYAFGYGGNDTLRGSDSANNFLYGGIGDDTVTGASRDDFLFGQSGNDTLTAGAGTDHLFGGDGNDVLIGGAGYDQLRGDKGADRFVTDGVGNDVIIDLVPGTDKLQIPSMTTWASVKAKITQVDADADGKVDDVKIVTPAGSVVLIDVTANRLSTADFVGLTS